MDPMGIFPIENWCSSKVLWLWISLENPQDESVDVRLATVNSSGFQPNVSCWWLVAGVAGVAGGAIIGFIQQTLEFHYKFQRDSFQR